MCCPDDHSEIEDLKLQQGMLTSDCLSLSIPTQLTTASHKSNWLPLVAHLQRPVNASVIKTWPTRLNYRPLWSSISMMSQFHVGSPEAKVRTASQLNFSLWQIFYSTGGDPKSTAQSTLSTSKYLLLREPDLSQQKNISMFQYKNEGSISEKKNVFNGVKKNPQNTLQF